MEHDIKDYLKALETHETCLKTAIDQELPQNIIDTMRCQVILMRMGYDTITKSSM